MKKLKIGILFDDSLDRPDGVQQYIKVLGAWLTKRGHSVTYLVGQSKPDATGSVLSLARNISVRGNQNTLSVPLPGSLDKIRAALKRDFDVIHVQMPFNPLLAGRFLKRLTPATAVVGTFHIVSERRREKLGSKLLSWLQAGTLKKFDRVVAVSAAAQAFARQYFGLESSVIPNAVDLSRFKRVLPNPELMPTKFTIVFLGRLVERKGVQYLLESLAIMKTRGQLEDTTVHICGDGPLRPVLESFLSENNLADNVIMHGFIDEASKAEYLASADFSIFPSTGGESFGIVLVEAMAGGNSLVLAGKNQGYQTVLGGEPGVMFNPVRPDELATKLAELKTNPENYQRLRAWQKHLVENYDIEKVGPAIEKLYHEAIDKRLAR